MRTVRVGGHEVIVVGQVPCGGLVRYTAHCRFCGLVGSNPWVFTERPVGIADAMVAEDLVRQPLERAPKGMACRDVKDWLIALEVMES